MWKFHLFVLQSLFEGQSASWDVAKKEQNRTKNRYGNIIACKQAKKKEREREIQKHEGLVIIFVFSVNEVTEEP